MGPRQLALLEAWEKYEGNQGFGTLEEIDVEKGLCRCALGVACRVAMDLGLDIRCSVYQSLGSKITEFENIATSLPERVRNFFKFADAIGSPVIGADSVVVMNDVHALPLKEIAKKVREGKYFLEDV